MIITRLQPVNKKARFGRSPEPSNICLWYQHNDQGQPQSHQNAFADHFKGLQADLPDLILILDLFRFITEFA
jgi:hypothetical protein